MESLQFSVREIDGDLRVIRIATLDDGAMALEQVQQMKNEGVLDESAAGAAALIIATKILYEANLEAMAAACLRQAEQRRRRWRGVATFLGVLAWAAAIFGSLVMLTRE